MTQTKALWVHCRNCLSAIIVDGSQAQTLFKENFIDHFFCRNCEKELTEVVKETLKDYKRFIDTYYKIYVLIEKEVKDLGTHEISKELDILLDLFNKYVVV